MTTSDSCTLQVKYSAEDTGLEELERLLTPLDKDENGQLDYREMVTLFFAD